MITLAIECATKVASAALLNGEQVAGEIFLGTGRHHSETVMQSINALLTLAEQKIEDIDLLTCTTGPGSFTGVRIGIATLKGLALATGVPVVGVSTLEVLAMNLGFSRKLVSPLLDARKNQVYAGLYRIGDDGLPEAQGSDYLADIDAVLHAGHHREIDFVGDGALKYRHRILEMHPSSVVFDSWKLNYPLASSVALLAASRYRQGKNLCDPFTLTPTYLRLSEAEQKINPEN